MSIPFHQFTEKKPGDRVKIAKNPLDESKGFDYGTVIVTGLRTQYTNRGIRVQMDEAIPYFRSDEWDIYPSEIFILAQ